MSNSARGLKARSSALEIETVKVKWFVSRLEFWFQRHGRDFPWRRAGEMDIYQLVLVELLLQRTRAETVSSFCGEFFLKFPSWKSLAASSQTELEAALKSVGLYRRRAELFRALGQAVCKQNARLPDSREELERLPGIGPYMASAILMYRDRLPEPLLDGGIARLLERYFGSRELADIRHDPFLNTIAHRVVRAADSPKNANWAMLDVAAKICLKRGPRCCNCPLSERCPSARTM